MKNKLIFWEPCDGIAMKVLDLLEWKWDDSGVTIFLTDNEKNYILRFRKHVCSFRSSSEYYMWRARIRHNIWVDESCKIKSWSFFKIKNSEYKEWFRRENKNLYKNEIDLLVHYVIYTVDEIIDILNDRPPEVYVEKL